MAAHRAFFSSSSFGVLLRPRNTLVHQGRTFAKPASVSLCIRSSFSRNHCKVSTSNKMEKPRSEFATTTTSNSRAPFKAQSYRVRKLCEDQKLEDASDLLENLLANYGGTKINFTSVFNCVLHHAVKTKDNKIVDYLLYNMTKHDIKRDSATYYILALYYSQRGMLDEGIKALKDMQTDRVTTSPRNYQPLLYLAASMGKLETMFLLYDEMKAKHDACHQFDAIVINGVVNSTESHKWINKVTEILHNMRKDRVLLPLEDAEAVKRWFESQDEENWLINWSTVTSSGVCESCSHTLESGALSSLEHAVLEQHIIDYLWSCTKGRKMTSYTTIGSFADKHYPEDGHHLPYSLEKYIHETGPYDVVLDALNVGYYGNKGEFHPKQVEETVKYFLDEGKKVLVVGAPPMLTRKMRNASQEDFTSLIDIIYKNCGLFLIRVRSNKNVHKLCIPDDIFILLAAVHCGLNTLLVSNDLFQDHMHKLPLNAQALLGRWLRSNQVLLERFPNGNRISYKRHPSYDSVVQTTGHIWHLPLDDDISWLCVNSQSQ